MSELTDYAQHAHARWRLSILLPAWIAQIAMLLGLMGIFSYRLAETLEHWDEMKEAGDVPRVEFVWECTNIGFSFIALLATIIEVAKLVGELLTPFLMVAMNAIKLTLAFANLGLDVVVYLQRSEREYSIVGLAIDCGLLAVTLGTFIYAVIVFRRQLKQDKHDLNNNFKMGANRSSVQMFATGTPASRKGSEGFAVAVEDTSYPSQTTPHSTALKSHIDRAVGTEFGWGSGMPTAGRVERSDSFVGSRLVQACTAQSLEAVRRDSESVTLEEERDEGDDDATVKGSHDGGRQIIGHRREGSEDTHALLGEHGREDVALPFKDQPGR